MKKQAITITDETVNINLGGGSPVLPALVLGSVFFVIAALTTPKEIMEHYTPVFFAGFVVFIGAMAFLSSGFIMKGFRVHKTSETLMWTGAFGKIEKTLKFSDISRIIILTKKASTTHMFEDDRISRDQVDLIVMDKENNEHQAFRHGDSELARKAGQAISELIQVPLEELTGMQAPPAPIMKTKGGLPDE